MQWFCKYIRLVVFFPVIGVILIGSWSQSFAEVPIIDSIDPFEGNQGEQDLFVTLTGQNFEDGASIFFENPGISVDGPVTFIDSTTLEFYIDITFGATPGPGDVFVINPGFEQDALPDGFTVLPIDAPTVTGVVPDNGYTGDAGLSVTIVGTLLYTVNNVDFGAGITVDSIDFIGSTNIDCTITINWLATPGFRDVTVFSIYGDNTLTNGFEILGYAAPQLVDVVQGSECRGVSGLDLTVTGAGFLNAVDLDFQPAGITINTLQYVSSNQVDINVDLEPSSAYGFYTLFATNPDQQTAFLLSAFEILDCSSVIDLVNPNQGTQGDIGLPVTITGSGFGNVQSVDFGSGITVFVNSFNDTLIDVTLDIALLAFVGFRDVTVTNEYGPGTAINAFEVLDLAQPQPVIDSIDPTQGMQGDSGLLVTIYGQDLDSVTTVDFGLGIDVTITDVQTDQISVSLDIQPDAPAGFHNVSVDGLFGGDTLIGGFEVLVAPPQIDSVDPDQGLRGAQDLPVIIHGSHLSEIDTVDFGSGITPLIIISGENEIYVQLDIDELAILGPRDVMVSGSNGLDTLPNGFEVILGPPEIQNVIPFQGAQNETLDVTITGNSFDLVNDVDFGLEITINWFTVIAFDQIDVNITIDPLATPGFRDVTVTDSNLQWDTLLNGFEVTEEPLIPPTIFGIDPGFGYQGDINLLLQVTGSDFQDGLTVDFGHPGIQINYVAFGDQSFFDVSIDIDNDATPGFTDVVVTNPDNGADVVVNGFEVLEVIHEILLDTIDPNQGYQGETVGFSITGDGFQAGALVEFIPDSSFFEIYTIFISSSLIEGYVIINDDAPIGFQTVRVTNPDQVYAELVNGFEVLEFIQEFRIDSISPDQGYQGETLNIQITGVGLEFGALVEFLPDSGFFDIIMTVISSSLIEGYVIIHADAPVGFQTVRVTNPDQVYVELVNGFEVLEFIDEFRIDWINPNQGYRNETLNIQITGVGFDVGAFVDFLPDGSYFDVFTTVMSSNLIEGSLTIHSDAPPGFHSVRVTNPDFEEAVLIDGFEVLVEVLPPPMPGNLTPSEVCIGAQYETFILWGQYFQPGIVAEFEYGGIPANEIYDVSTVYIDDQTIEITLSVREDAVAGFYDLRITNPDGQFAYGPSLEVIDCAGVPYLIWVESRMDILIEYDGLAGGIATGLGSATIQNIGDGDYEFVVISSTDFVSDEGFTIEQESLEIDPSLPGYLVALESREVDFYQTILIYEELLTAGGGVFSGELLAQDSNTGDMAILPVRITIITLGTQLVEIDPICLLVDLYGPGGPADLLPEGFYDDPNVISVEIIDLLGGCESQFPLFQWGTYADNCPGYLVLWRPIFTLTLYPVYAAQSPEQAASNPPIWRGTRIDETFHQYSLAGEQLSGVYVWQIEAVPEPMPGMGVFVEPMLPVLSEIWAFCVDGEIAEEPVEVVIEGEIQWSPEEILIEGCGMVPGTLVLSDLAIGNVNADTPFSLILSDDNGGEVAIELSLQQIQFSNWNPLPEFGRVAIDFGINVTPSGPIGPDMGPENIAVQVYNGGILLASLQLNESSVGSLTLTANIGGLEAECSVLIIFPWDLGSCWGNWLSWWDYQQHIADYCEDDRRALDSALAMFLNAQTVYENARDALASSARIIVEMLYERNLAQNRYSDALQACRDFFTDSPYSGDISLTSPDEGWSYIETFGGSMGIWFMGENGAEALNDLIGGNSETYNQLWQALDNANVGLQSAGAAFNNANSSYNENNTAVEEAAANLHNAEEGYIAALAALNDCLDRLEDSYDAISVLELQFPECFSNLTGGRIVTGLGVPGLEGGPQFPPFGGNGSSGQRGPGTGIGQSQSVLPCDDCMDEWQALQDVEQVLGQARDEIIQAEERLDQALTVEEHANQALAEAQDIIDQAREVVYRLQGQLENFMDDHVFSNEVGGTPDHGQNHLNYGGVDIFFSDYQAFQSIFDLIKPWIDDLVAELEEARAAQNTARLEAGDASLEATRVFFEQLAAERACLNTETSITRAQNDRLAARAKYVACIERQRLCNEANGCPPFVPPHEISEVPIDPEEIAGPSPPGGWVTDENENQNPGDRSGDSSPPGISTGPAFGSDSPCGDCETEYGGYISAIAALPEAQSALDNAEEAYIYSIAIVQEFELQMIEAQANVDLYERALAELDSGNPSIGPESASIEQFLFNTSVELLLAEAAYGAVQRNTWPYYNGVVIASHQHAEAENYVDLAEQAYNHCMRHLHECEQENGSESSVDVSTPGSSDIATESPCPCDMCEHELASLHSADAARDAAEDTWLNALDRLTSAEEALIIIVGGLAIAEAELGEARNALQDFQSRFESILQSFESVEGVGSQPSDGASQVTYCGFTIYFNDYNNFTFVFNAIKDAIRELAELRSEAEARVTGAEQVLASAEFEAATSPSNLDNTRAAEQAAFDSLVYAEGDFVLALSIYVECLLDRQECLDANPVECAREALEPYVGGSGYGGYQPSEENRGQMLEGIRDEKLNRINTFEGYLEDIRNDLQMADDDRDLAESELDDSLNALGNMVSERLNVYQIIGDLLESLPDSAFLSDDYLGPLDNYDRVDVGGYTVYYPSEISGDVDAWLGENRTQLEELSPLVSSGLIYDLASKTGEILDRLADAIISGVDPTESIAMLNSEIDSLVEMQDFWTQLVEDRKQGIDEANTLINAILDQMPN